MSTRNVAWMWDVFASYSVEDSYRGRRENVIGFLINGFSLAVFLLNLAIILLMLNTGDFKQASVLILCNALVVVCSIRHYIASKLYDGCLRITEYTRPESDKERVMSAGYLIDVASGARVNTSISEEGLKGYWAALSVWYRDPNSLIEAIRVVLFMAIIGMCCLAISVGFFASIDVVSYTPVCLFLILLSAILKIRRANKLSGYVLERQFALNTCRSNLRSKEFVFKRR